MAPMFTRKAAALEEQQKLKNALHEIKSLKQLNTQLLKEQDESEAEMRIIIARNSQLKSELANLHNAHTLLSEERDQLQLAVGSFNQCIQTYEEALGKISMLEDELSKSQQLICDLQSQIASYETQKTNNLYDELLASSSTAPVLTIGLTCDSPCAANNKPHSETIHLNSHKKIKKYIKIGKLIKKTKKLIKFQKLCNKNIRLRKERSDLLNKLNTYCSSLQEMRVQYETDVRSLNEEILKLENSLKTVTSQYELSQKQVGEHILAADELLALSNYNIDRLDSLINRCECSNKYNSRRKKRDVTKKTKTFVDGRDYPVANEVRFKAQN
ncbi:protein lava lamp-like [Maniola jurtina]|uniref:protein lava lamp-like n=1 Tax=Maniola jurtina TaxID=191418 RepID=UPI001E68EA8C|nr:protein lava lamp-like [Maniola jurtina]